MYKKIMIFIADELELKFNWHEHPIYGLYFYRSNIPFHSKMLNIIEQIYEKYPKVLFYAIDADNFVGSCIRFGVTCVPTLLAFSYGKEVGKIVNSVKTKEFIHFFDDICTRSNLIGENHAK